MIKVISVEDRGWYEIRHEAIDIKGVSTTLVGSNVYLKSGEYIGGLAWFNLLLNWGIEPECIEKDRNICTIGFCKEQEKWYGWDDCDIEGFGIGDMKYDPILGKRGEYPIMDLKDARNSAIDFSRKRRKKENG